MAVDYQMIALLGKFYGDGFPDTTGSTSDKNGFIHKSSFDGQILIIILKSLLDKFVFLIIIEEYASMRGSAW